MSNENYYEPWDSRYNKRVPPGSMIEGAYQLLKGDWGIPAFPDGKTNPPVALNHQDEDMAKQLALTAAQRQTGLVDPPYSLVKAYEDQIRQVFQSRVGTQNITGTEGTSSGVPHGPDETGTSTASNKPAKIGWTDQNQPQGAYRTTDAQKLPTFSPGEGYPPHQTGQGVTPNPGGKGGYAHGPGQSELVTGTTGKGGSESEGGTLGVGYHTQQISGYSATGYDTALGEKQQVKKEHKELLQRFIDGQDLPEFAKAGPVAGTSQSAMAYRESPDTHAAGGSAKMEDLAEAAKLEEIGQRLLEEAEAEESGSRIKNSKKRMMSQKAFQQSSEILRRYKGSAY